MTEEYWQRYKKQYDQHPFQTNELWKGVISDIKKDSKGKHHMELYNICRSENPYIRQVRNSPNITVDTVAELICRSVGCDLQSCLMKQSTANQNSKKPVPLNGCSYEYRQFSDCLVDEKNRLRTQEDRLKQLVGAIREGERIIQEN